jgi:hypothetical protein
MRSILLSFVAAAAAVASAPAIGRDHSAPLAGAAHHTEHRDSTATLLRARIAGLYARIDRLRERGAIGSEEALELRKQARRLQSQLNGLSAREVSDVELGIARIESRATFAADDGRSRSLDRYADRDRYERFDRYDADRHGDYEHFDRYTGSSVDRWHDPFDRGNER